MEIFQTQSLFLILSQMYSVSRLMFWISAFNFEADKNSNSWKMKTYYTVGLSNIPLICEFQVGKF
jgi:hypothetical protein